MLTIRRAQDRGHAHHDWLDSFHTFSFGSYYDPEHMGFGFLRVINDDRIAGGSGFDTHPHKDMEIITFVLSGVLEHRDSMGNSALIKPGEVQRMSAGSGIEHSEFNHLPDQETHLLQIWIKTASKGIKPSYAQKSFAEALEKNSFVLAVSRDGRDGSITMNQDATMSIGRFRENECKAIPVAEGRKVWMQNISGVLAVNGVTLQNSDGLAVDGEKELQLQARTDAHFLYFEI